MIRRTKIVATLGPATDDPVVLERLLLAGVNMVRLNFSHGDADSHRQRARQVREICQRLGISVAVLGDLQGPKIRISRFRTGKVVLKRDAPFCLDAGLEKEAGDEGSVGIAYKELPADSKPGDILLLDDGRIVLEVERIEGSRIHTRVRVGGELSNNKGINRQGGGLSAPALTDKDKQDIVLAAEIDIDYLAVSFPRSAEDIEQARSLLREAGGSAFLMAKIERAEAVADDDTLDSIICASDAVMVARGDLGVEIGDAELIGKQKEIIARARKLNRVVVTATQMMESMIHNSLPTRAEVFDVANAVLDGTDAVMLSAETATGDDPCGVVEAMSRICIGAQTHRSVTISRHRVDTTFSTVEEAIAMAAMYSANHLEGVSAIVCLTESGTTPLLMSRISSGLPIYAMTPHPATQRRVALYRGVEPVPFTIEELPEGELALRALNLLRERGAIREGELVILTRGDQLGVGGGTNSLRIYRA
ncbi:pyruvate kinase [Aestuariirhabdus litorea]|uniref:Pyruvate kinase n=1 Tax=Aestuariirhabdus litorea TaxID=2528527 RepID=A0A3P3VS14_9GAMM|nr:pyruvate kinase [Aestuariirhabdus litorea]RRJ85420.1 pyruvate kinase [Aestuariirhabdus litorea]RWW98644.1 pyruvate kinase [Endozoicomonadaceae bacterium GTF-13]